MGERTITRTVSVDDRWDVVVLGGGPAGCTAAASAAREGAKTLLVEATGFLGGMGTGGLVPAWCPFTDKQGTILYAGMAEQVLKATMAAMPHLPPEKLDWTPIYPERLKVVYDELVLGHGAEILFHTVLAGVETDGAGRVEAALVANKAGLTAIEAPVFVDCTGDADLAAWAGAEYEKGDPDDGDLQPATHCFVITNVDDYAYQHAERGLKYHHKGGKPLIDDILASGKYPEIPDTHGCNSLLGPGAVGFNSGHLWEVDNTDPVSLSRALPAGRKQAWAFRNALAEFFPSAFGNGWLAMTGSLLGIRETRRILGDYVLTVEDWEARRGFPDEICRNNYFIDVHHKKTECDAFADGGLDSEAIKVKARHMGPGESHGIPYRCLTPKGLHNVLMAGRAISTDRVVQGSTRVMPVCLAMGEAAGMAAAMAVKTPAPGDGAAATDAAGGGGRTADVRAVDTDALRARLREVGAYLP